MGEKMLEIRPLTLSDNLESVAELIYITDKYIYPTWFKTLNHAKTILPYIMTKKCIYNYKNILIAVVDEKIVGALVYLDSFPENNYLEIKRAYQESKLSIDTNFEHVNQYYLNTLKDSLFGRNIVCLAVLPEYRHKHIATYLLNSIKEKKQSLAVVKDNHIALELYKKCGFQIYCEYAGYLDVPCYEMRKEL